MNKEITKITRNIPQDTTLPDGSYHGIWGGYNIVVNHGGVMYDLTTKEGVRGVGYKVLVQVKYGIATFVN